MSKAQDLGTTVFILVGVLVWILSCGDPAPAFDFHADTAHGNTSYGVNRSGTGYPRGECAHCHDTFDQSTCGVNELMFFAPYGSGTQSDNFCFLCHTGSGSVQTNMPGQYSYSYRASGDTGIICPGSILEAFSFINESGSSVLNCDSQNGTSHKLTDIKNFLAGKWGYTTNSNPCTGCHNPHPPQRDAHTEGNRGWLVSLPSGHADPSTWQLWGDDSNERMDQHTIYQAPHAVSGFEPDGSTTQDGSNLTDYVTFCTDCHDNSNQINSTVLGRELYLIDWSVEKHGAGAAGDCAPRLLSPYAEAQCGSYVVACTDCHEPHGAPNIFLTRQKVNNGDVTVLTGDGYGPDGRANKEWVYLCGKCHDGLLASDVHSHPTDIDGDQTDDCTTCHFVHDALYRPCSDCHYHGSNSIDGVPYGEPLF